jgi:hypothetical protein
MTNEYKSGWIGGSEAARRLGLSPGRISQLIKAKRIPYRISDHKVFWPDVQLYCDNYRLPSYFNKLPRRMTTFAQARQADREREMRAPAARRWRELYERGMDTTSVANRVYKRELARSRAR